MADEQPAPEETEITPATGETQEEEIASHLTPVTETESPGTSEVVPPQETPVESPPLTPKVEDEALAWLESIAAGEQASVEEVLKKEAETHTEEMVGEIEESKMEPPLQEETVSSEISQEDITFTTWLKKQDVKEALEKAKSAFEESPESPDLQKSEEMPEWLREPAQPKEQEEAAVPPSGLVGEPVISILEDESIPAPQPSPPGPGEWLPVEEKPAPESEVETEPEVRSVPEAPPEQLRVLGGTGMLSRIPSEDKDGQTLIAAQTALDANLLDEATQYYAKLIKKNRLLDEVIHDLREAIYRYPVDISIWQTLGDACMRGNRLQDALDAYTKAEELLR
jgi:tetratricopeptide (TPR) repeat protein